MDSSANSIASPDDYTLYPRQGIVVFKTKKTGNYLINITNNNSVKIGLKVINRKKEDHIRINSISEMHV